jgi:four helix bundle protein
MAASLARHGQCLNGGMARDVANGIDERSFRFFRDVLTFVDTIPPGPKAAKIIEQLVAAAGSIGSNREEALGASSRREFVRFNEIALRSANESARWLRACAANRLGETRSCVRLLDEARQIARIIARIIIETKRRGLDTRT